MEGTMAFFNSLFNYLAHNIQSVLFSYLELPLRLMQVRMITKSPARNEVHLAAFSCISRSILFNALWHTIAVCVSFLLLTVDSLNIFSFCVPRLRWKHWAGWWVFELHCSPTMPPGYYCPKLTSSKTQAQVLQEMPPLVLLLALQLRNPLFLPALIVAHQLRNVLCVLTPWSTLPWCRVAISSAGIVLCLTRQAIVAERWVVTMREAALSSVRFVALSFRAKIYEPCLVMSDSKLTIKECNG